MGARGVAAMLGMVAIATAGCGGDPTRSAPDRTPESSIAQRVTTAATTSNTTPSFQTPDYGIEPTDTASPQTGCPLSDAAADVHVRADAAGSPTAVVAVPDGFTAASRAGTARLTMSGPGGLTAAVEVRSADPDPRTAFSRYISERIGGSQDQVVNVLPGPMCGYSGQRIGGLLDGDDFADRIVHVGTGAGDFLLVVALQGPSGAGDFGAARSALLADFGVRLP